MRTLEQIQDTLRSAKIEESSNFPTSQVLTFSSEPWSDIFLAEVDKEVLETLEQEGQLVLRGRPEDSAVLCSERQTWDVKETISSNALLLLPTCSFPSDLDSQSTSPQAIQREIAALCPSFLELRPKKVDFGTLKRLLKQCPYSGPEHEGDPEILCEAKFSLEGLLDEVQVSKYQLIEYLEQWPDVCLIDGHWRLIDFQYLIRVITHILQLIEEMSWDYRSFSSSETIRVLSEIEPEPILHRVLKWYTEQIDETPDLVSLSTRSMCRFYAKVLLKPAGRYAIDDFLEAWQGSVPHGMKTELSYLSNMSLITCTGNGRTEVPAYIEYYPLEDLPEGLEERFDALFTKKSKWKKEEIIPYLQDLVSGKQQDVSFLLTKYARSSGNEKDGKFYTSRKASLL